MLVPFVKNGVDSDYFRHQDIDGYFATRYERNIQRANDLVVLNKDGETVNYGDASVGDTFTYSAYKYDIHRTRLELAKTDGFFMDNETPFEATMEFIKIHTKGIFIFGERGTENYHLIYPDHLGKAMKRTAIIGGVFEGMFKYTRKGNVWCIKMI